MGRTVLPFNRILQDEFASWGKFRRALRKEDQEALDALFAAAKQHVAAAGYASRLSPLEAILVAILIEHQKTLDALRRRLAGPDALPDAGAREQLAPPAATE